MTKRAKAKLKESKVATSFRLTPETRGQLARLAAALRLSQASVVELAVQLLGKREKVE